ncbi:MAG: hypothetical protein HY900_31480 [Deltaproteobacteria bacterium]|nr:hypothetical protein [Deltaproteobacteria bacterium]
MRTHPYLRAYMAGIVVPTLFLLLVVAVDAWRHFYFEVPNQFVIPLPSAPLARAYLFPMAIVPNAWGLWNMLHLALESRSHPLHLPLGLHGALLVVVLIPAGVALAGVLDHFSIQMRFALPMIPIGMGVYYLAWKHLVGRLNAVVGVGEV